MLSFRARCQIDDETKKKLRDELPAKRSQPPTIAAGAGGYSPKDWTTKAEVKTRPYWKRISWGVSGAL